MSVKLRNLGALLLLAAAASLSWYFSRSPEAPSRPAAGADSAPLGYYLREATLLGTDEAGRALLHVYAAEAVQERDAQGLALTGVRIEYRDEQAVDWAISAERAESPGDQSYIDLEHVRLESDEAADGQHTVIESPHLRLDPEAYYAFTDARVDVRIGATILHGVGLETRLREDRFKLKSDVHGRFTR